MYMVIELTPQEFHTVLAALRYYQGCGMGNPIMRTNDIHEIATNGATETSLDAEGIDVLCERINLAEKL